MYQISNEAKELFLTDGTRKNFTVHFPNGEYRDLGNSDIVAESLSFQENLCQQSDFKFGLCEANHISFQTIGVEANLKGAEIECAIGVGELSEWNDAEGISLTEDIIPSSGMYRYSQIVFTDSLSDYSLKGIRFSTESNELIQTYYIEVVTDTDTYTYPINWIKVSGKRIYNSEFDVEHWKSQILAINIKSQETSARDMGINSIKFLEPMVVKIGRFTIDSCKKKVNSNIRTIEAYGKSITSAVKISEFEQSKRKMPAVKATGYEDSIKYRINPYHFVMQETGQLFDFCTLTPIPYTSDESADYITTRNSGFIKDYNHIPENGNEYLKGLYFISAKKSQYYDRLYKEYGNRIRPRLYYKKCIGSYTSSTGLVWSSVTPLDQNNWDTKWIYLDINKPFSLEFPIFQSKYIDSNFSSAANNECNYFITLAWPVTAKDPTTGYRRDLYDFIDTCKVENIPYEDTYFTITATEKRKYKYQYGAKTKILEEYFLPEKEITSTATLSEKLNQFWELQGKFLRFNRASNRIEEVAVGSPNCLSPSTDLYPATDLYPNRGMVNQLFMSDYISTDVSEEEIPPYGTVMFDYMATDTDGNGVVVQDYYTFDENSSGVYYLEQNEYLITKIRTKEEVISLLEESFIPNITGMRWTRLEADYKGRPWFETGDYLSINGINERYLTIIFSRTLNGIQALRETVDADVSNGDYSIIGIERSE